MLRAGGAAPAASTRRAAAAVDLRLPTPPGVLRAGVTLLGGIGLAGLIEEAAPAVLRIALPGGGGVLPKPAPLRRPLPPGVPVHRDVYVSQTQTKSNFQ